MSRVLITGGSGFIGSHLIRACLARGDEVSVIRRAGSDMWRVSECEDQLDQHQVELTDQAALSNCLKRVQPDQIFHLAARTRFTPSAGCEDLQCGIAANFAPVVALLKAICDMRHPPAAVVRTGSIAEYGNAKGPYHESLREEPTGAYGYSMLAGTQFIEAARSRLTFPVITARLALTYGPTQSRDFLVPALIDHCLRGAPYDVRRPDDRRDMIHVSDVVSALLRLADKAEVAPPVLNVASGFAPTMREIANEVAQATGAPNGLIRMGQQDPGDLSALTVDPAKMNALLDWSPKTDFSDGIIQCVKAAKAETDSPKRRSA